MDKQQAQQIIEDTFESSFDEAKFTNFIKNLLNSIDDAPFTYQGNYIPDAYKQSIKTLERIAKFNDGENSIDILIITLQKQTSLERARTMQRNFIAWYLNGSRGGEMKDAALAAFVSPGKEDWRFSLVKMDYKFKKTKSGRMKVKEEFTPARRWSFLVGENEKSHTAQSRLVNILANDEHDPTLKEIEKAFDIETVTKEFFFKYRELFLHTKEELDQVIKKDPKIKADFKDKSVDTVNFAKKLLGQIVFLYFLQKKGWFGVGRDNDWGTGSKHFLRELFKEKHGSFKNFFNDILEPLFYEALRLDRSHDDGYYSRFNCKIPFLNGGLFDPIGIDKGYNWVDTDILLPDKLFSNKIKTKEGDTGTGILDVFDRYNFTVKEDEPLEKEVAIDPELLGKAYEKFNAIRPDNYDEFKKALKSGKTGEENKFNKKFGVYYTPREIVHYMCQQSLINYLHTELNSGTTSYEKLGKDQLDMLGNKGKKGQLDLTIENKPKSNVSKEDIEALIHIGEQVSENEAIFLEKEQKIKKGEQKTTRIKLKLPENIRKNAKLIDDKLEEITVCDPAVGSGAFPVGMMSEIVKARNILSIFLNEKERTIYDFKRRCIEHSLYGVDIDPGAVEIAKLRLWLSLVVDEDDIKNIKSLPNLDYKIMCGNSLLGVEKNLFNNELFTELERLKPLYFDETNPSKKQEYKSHIDDLISKITDGHKEFDFEVYFSEVFHEKASPERSRRGGFDVVIANPPYINIVKLSEKQRKAYRESFSITKNKVDLYAYFIESSERILNYNSLLCFIIPQTWKATDSFSKLREFIFLHFRLDKIVNLEFGTFEATVRPLIILMTKNDKKEKYEIDILKNDFSLLNRINVEEIYGSSQHIVDTESSSDDKIIFKKIEDKCVTLESVIQFTRGIKTSNDKRFIHKERKNRDYRKLFRGKNIKAYSLHWSGEYIWYRPDLMREKVGCLPHSKKLFEVPEKLITQRVNSSMQLLVAYDTNESFFLDTTNVSKSGTLKNNYQLKFILTILNSRLINYWYCKKYRMPTIGLYELHSIPIKPIEKRNQNPFICLADKILALTESDDYLESPQKQAKVKALEAKIDQHVYKLYDLTPEDIEIVEGEK